MTNQHLQQKIKTQESLQKALTLWRFKNKKIVFTNGCFDLLHYGHIHYLAEARALGDLLIVGLNAAASVQRLKGKHRPINDDTTRQSILAALFFVDAVIEFSEDTPYNLIQTIQPDVLVKGGDWKVEDIVGSDLVLNNGGEVKSLPFVEGYSTTLIEERIRGRKF